MNRNKCSHGTFTLAPVEDFTIFTGFSCLHPDDTDRDLDEFIQEDAYRHHLDKIATTYALISCDCPHIPIGFASLQNDAIVIPDGENLPEVTGYLYRFYPAVKIGRLGVHVEMQGKKYGSLLLYLIKKLMTQENRTGCRFITVDARRDKKNHVDATGFYHKNGFEKLLLRAKTSRYVPMYYDLQSFVA